MWNYLDINVTENNQTVPKIFYYDCTVYDTETMITRCLEQALANEPIKDAMLLDMTTASYITKMCQEAFTAGNNAGIARVKQQILKTLEQLN